MVYAYYLEIYTLHLYYTIIFLLFYFHLHLSPYLEMTNLQIIFVVCVFFFFWVVCACAQVPAGQRRTWGGFKKLRTHPERLHGQILSGGNRTASGFVIPIHTYLKKFKIPICDFFFHLCLSIHWLKHTHIKNREAFTLSTTQIHNSHFTNVQTSSFAITLFCSIPKGHSKMEKSLLTNSTNAWDIASVEWVKFLKMLINLKKC